MSCLEVPLLWERSRLLVECDITISILNSFPHPNEGYVRVFLCPLKTSRIYIYTHIDVHIHM